MGLKVCADNVCFYDFYGDAGCPPPDAGLASDAGR
jgi:hypothetical protein